MTSSTTKTAQERCIHPFLQALGCFSRSHTWLVYIQFLITISSPFTPWSKAAPPKFFQKVQATLYSPSPPPLTRVPPLIFSFILTNKISPEVGAMVQNYIESWYLRHSWSWVSDFMHGYHLRPLSNKNFWGSYHIFIFDLNYGHVSFRNRFVETFILGG